VYHRERVEDPWFAATQEVPVKDENTKVLFIPDEPARVVGCTYQSTICNPELAGSPCAEDLKDEETRLAKMWPDDLDRAAIMGFIFAFSAFSILPESIYEYPGLPSLLSRFTLDGPLQVDAIPFNQWQKEMEYTFQITLASFQSAMAAATQKGALWFRNETYCPTPKACQALCRNQASHPSRHIVEEHGLTVYQKIRSPDFYSFSVLGVSVILCTGLFLMSVSTWIESIAAFLLRCRGWGRSGSVPKYAMLEWNNNSALQLQRLAHEAVGSGTWIRTTRSVPVTECGETLGALDVSDPEHVRLRRHASSQELSNLYSNSNHGENSSHSSTTMNNTSSDTLRPRYYSGLRYKEDDTHDCLRSPDDFYEGDDPMATRSRSSSSYMRVAAQEYL
jgi:hypothetical protein